MTGGQERGHVYAVQGLSSEYADDRKLFYVYEVGFSFCLIEVFASLSRNRSQTEFVFLIGSILVDGDTRETEDNR